MSRPWFEAEEVTGVLVLEALLAAQTARARAEELAAVAMQAPDDVRRAAYYAALEAETAAESAELEYSRLSITWHQRLGLRERVAVTHAAATAEG